MQESDTPLSALAVQEFSSQFNMLGFLADGRRELQKLISDAWRVDAFITQDARKDGAVTVTLERYDVRNTLVLKDNLFRFPSETLKAKVMLVAG